MVNTKDYTTQDMIDKLQQVKGRTKLKIYRKISNLHDEMDYRRNGDAFQFEEDILSKNVKKIRENYHGVLLLMKISQTKPQVRSVNIKCYDLFSTVIKNRVDQEIANDHYRNDKDYVYYDDFIIPNFDVGIKLCETSLR